MTTSRIHLLAPFIAVACSSQVAELEPSEAARPARTYVDLGTNGTSAPTDNSIPSTPHRGPETRTTLRVGTKQGVSLSIEFAPPAAPAPSVDCTPLTLTLVGKRTAAVGESLPLRAVAGELEGTELEYAWSGPIELEVTGPDSALFLCDSRGEHEGVLRLTSPEACSTELPFTISCDEAE